MKPTSSKLLLVWAVAAFILAGLSLLLCAALLLWPKTPDASLTVPPASAAPEATPEPTAAPEATPAPTAAPEPTPMPTWAERFAEHFSAETVWSADGYRSPTLAVSLTEYDHPGAHPTLRYHVADVYLTDIRQLRAAYSLEAPVYASPLRIAASAGAVFAVNGDTLVGQTWGFVARNGEVISSVEPLYDICVLFRDGRIETYAPYTYSAQALVDTGALWQVWQFGPRLLDGDGLPLSVFNTSDTLLSRHPRTALGYYEPGHYCFVTVDGYGAGDSAGADMWELAQIMAELGCTAAYNLDGGPTSSMVYGGSYVNFPAGRETVNDMIVIRELEAG